MLQDALCRMDDSQLSVEQLTSLSRAIPEDSERKDLALYLEVTGAIHTFFRQVLPLLLESNCWLSSFRMQELIGALPILCQMAFLNVLKSALLQEHENERDCLDAG